MSEVRVFYLDDGGQPHLRSVNLNRILEALKLDEDMLLPNGSAARLNQSRYDCADELRFTILDLTPGINSGDNDIKDRITLRVLRDGLVVDEESGAWDGEVLFVIAEGPAGFFSSVDPVPVQRLATADMNDGVLEVESERRREPWTARCCGVAPGLMLSASV